MNNTDETQPVERRLTGSALGAELLTVLGIDCNARPVESITIDCRGGAHLAKVRVAFLVRPEDGGAFSRVLENYALVRAQQK